MQQEAKIQAYKVRPQDLKKENLKTKNSEKYLDTRYDIM
jgi:hypothetical protein